MPTYGPPNTPNPRPSTPSSPRAGSSPSDAGGARVGSVNTPVGKVYGVRDVPLGGGATASAGVSPRGGGRLGGSISVPFKKGGKVKKMAKGGSTASKRADGCATKGKTRGKMV